MSTRTTSRDDVETAVLAHALEVHQAELEAQNAELRMMVEELARTNTALTAARDRYRTLYDRSPTPMVTIDRGRLIVEANPAAAALFARPREALTGLNVELFVEHFRRKAFRLFLDEVFASGGGRSEDLVIVRDDDCEPPTVDVLIDGVALDRGTVPVCVLSMVDITGRRAVERARRKAQDEVLGFVSHDLRGPLNAIVLACDALKGGVERSEAEECVGAIEKAAGRSVRLIRDLLQVVHIESGELTINRSWFDAGDLARSLCDDHQQVAAAATCELTCNVAPGTLAVYADRDRLYQAAANLLANAFIHARGAPVEVAVRDGGTAVMLSVTDEGPGIPVAEQARVFDRFRQGGRSRGGAGLGLAIVKGIVTAHGGTVTLRSQPGLGACFELTIPRGGTPPAG